MEKVLQIFRMIVKTTILFVLLIAVLFLLNVALKEIGCESILWKDFMLKISTYNFQHNFQIAIFMAWLVIFLIIWAFPKLFE